MRLNQNTNHVLLHREGLDEAVSAAIRLLSGRILNDTEQLVIDVNWDGLDSQYVGYIEGYLSARGNFLAMTVLESLETLQQHPIVQEK